MILVVQEDPPKTFCSARRLLSTLRVFAYGGVLHNFFEIEIFEIWNLEFEILEFGNLTLYFVRTVSMYGRFLCQQLLFAGGYGNIRTYVEWEME